MHPFVVAYLSYGSIPNNNTCAVTDQLCPTDGRKCKHLIACMVFCVMLVRSYGLDDMRSCRRGKKRKWIQGEATGSLGDGKKCCWNKFNQCLAGACGFITNTPSYMDTTCYIDFV